MAVQVVSLVNYAITLVNPAYTLKPFESKVFVDLLDITSDLATHDLMGRLQAEVITPIDLDDGGGQAIVTAKSAIEADALVSGGGKPLIGISLGDSNEPRGGNTFPLLGGGAKAIKSITVDGDGLLVEVTAHGFPAGSPVRIDSDSPVDPGIRNRWFDCTSQSANFVRLTVPADALDRTNLLECVRNAEAYSDPALTSNPPAYLQLDVVRGNAGSLSETFYRLGQPLDRFIDLGVPGAKAGGTARTDLRSVADSIDFIPLYYVNISVLVNDMDGGLAAAQPAIDGVLYVANKALRAGCIVSIDEAYPQNPMTQAKQDFINAVNPALRAFVNQQQRAYLVPVHSIINDPTTNAGTAVDLVDSRHKTAVGAIRIGGARADVLAPVMKRRISGVLPAGVTNYLTNGTMAGTGGTVNAPATGVAPTGWSLSRPDTAAAVSGRKQRGFAKLWRPGTVYAVGDVVLPTTKTPFQYCCTATTGAATSGSSAPTWGTVAWANTTDNEVTWTAVVPLPNLESRSEWMSIQNALGGSIGSAQERFSFEQDVTLASVGLAVGDWVQTGARVIALDSGYRNLMWGVRTKTQVAGLFLRAVDGGKNAFIDPANQTNSDASGVRMTDPWKIPQGVTQITVFLEGGHGQAPSLNSTMRAFVTDAFLRKA